MARRYPSAPLVARRNLARLAGEVNPSRPFILRPVATSLLMVARSVVGRDRLQATAGLSAAGGRLSNDPSGHVLSRRESGRGGVGDYCAAGTTVRTSAGLEPDDLGQFGRQLDHHAAVRPQPEHRRCRTGSAGGINAAQTFFRPICRRRRSTASRIRPTRRC